MPIKIDVKTIISERACKIISLQALFWYNFYLSLLKKIALLCMKYIVETGERTSAAVASKAMSGTEIFHGTFIRFVFLILCKFRTGQNL